MEIIKECYNVIDLRCVREMIVKSYAVVKGNVWDWVYKAKRAWFFGLTGILLSPFSYCVRACPPWFFCRLSFAAAEC